MKPAVKVKKQQVPAAVTVPWSWPYYIITPLLLLVAALICYWPSRQYAFQFDDLANITKN